MHRYDLASDSWEAMASLNEHRVDSAAIAVDAVGGEATSSVERYDPASNTSTLCTYSMATTHQFFAGCLVTM